MGARLAATPMISSTALAGASALIPEDFGEMVLMQACRRKQGKLRELPAAEAAERIDPRHPELAHRLSAEAPVALVARQKPQACRKFSR